MRCMLWVYSMNLDSCKPVFVFIFTTCAKGSSFPNIECCHVKKKKKDQFCSFKCFWCTKKTTTYVQLSRFIPEHFYRPSDQFCALKIKKLFYILSDPYFPPTLQRRTLNNKLHSIFCTEFTPTWLTLCASECRCSVSILGPSALTSKC